MERIPFWAWVGIAIIVIITIIINVSLVAMLRAKTPPRMSMRQSRSGGIIGTAQDLPEARTVQHGTGMVGDFLLGGEGKSSEAVAHRRHLTKRQQKPTRQRGRSPAST